MPKAMDANNLARVWEKIKARITPVSGGGTGGTTAAEARANLGIIDAIYPVGSVYIAYNSTSPASRFGGTWTAITGRFPYFNAGTGAGGSNTHTLTVAQMAAHRHALRLIHGSNGESASVLNWTAGVTTGWQTYEAVCNAAGGGTSHNNMPAYQTLYAWRRTA